MRVFFTLLICFASYLGYGNMAAPYSKGTLGASPFISKYVDIVKEKILIIPDSQFNTTQFKIEYHINAKKEGQQIPLLFYASEYKGDFKVWVDELEIQLSATPEVYENLEGSSFKDFSYIFEKSSTNNIPETVIWESSGGGFVVRLDDLKFFETSLSKGSHVIRVEYVADLWTDYSSWVKEYSFRYALSPAKYWKSFGNLEITVDATKCKRKLNSNLGEPSNGSLSGIAIYNFSGIPTEVLQISFTPEVSSLAQILISIGPLFSALAVGIILAIFHYRAVMLFRRKYPLKKYSWVMIAGSLIFPFITLYSYVEYYTIVDSIIGEEAARRHGYTFLIMIFYPVVTPVYLLLMWLCDRRLKRSTIDKVDFVEKSEPAAY